MREMVVSVTVYDGRVDPESSSVRVYTIVKGWFTKEGLPGVVSERAGECLKDALKQMDEISTLKGE